MDDVDGQRCHACSQRFKVQLYNHSSRNTTASSSNHLQNMFHHHRPLLLWSVLPGPPTTGQFTRTHRRRLQLISQFSKQQLSLQRAVLLEANERAQMVWTQHHFSDFIGKQHERGGLRTTMIRLRDGDNTSSVRLESNFELGPPGMIDSSAAPTAVASLLDLLFDSEHKPSREQIVTLPTAVSDTAHSTTVTTGGSSGKKVKFDVTNTDSTAYPTDAAVRAKERDRHRKAQAIDPTHALPAKKKKKFEVEQHFDDCGLDDSSLKQAMWSLDQSSFEMYDDMGHIMEEEPEQSSCSVFLSTLRGLGGSDTNDQTYAHIPEKYRYNTFSSFMADWSFPSQHSKSDSDHYIDVVEICGGNARTSQILIHRFHETKIGLNFDIVVGIDLLDISQEAALWQY